MWRWACLLSAGVIVLPGCRAEVTAPASTATVSPEADPSRSTSHLLVQHDRKQFSAIVGDKVLRFDAGGDVLKEWTLPDPKILDEPHFFYANYDQSFILTADTLTTLNLDESVTTHGVDIPKIFEHRTLFPIPSATTQPGQRSPFPGFTLNYVMRPDKNLDEGVYGTAYEYQIDVRRDQLIISSPVRRYFVALAGSYQTPGSSSDRGLSKSVMSPDSTAMAAYMSPAFPTAVTARRNMLETWNYNVSPRNPNGTSYNLKRFAYPADTTIEHVDYTNSYLCFSSRSDTANPQYKVEIIDNVNGPTLFQRSSNKPINGIILANGKVALLSDEKVEFVDIPTLTENHWAVYRFLVTIDKMVRPYLPPYGGTGIHRPGASPESVAVATKLKPEFVTKGSPPLGAEIPLQASQTGFRESPYRIFGD